MKKILSKNDGKVVVSKNELVQLIAQTAGVQTVVVKTILRDYQRNLLIQLKTHGEVKFLDLGKVKVSITKPRNAINPKTKETIHVPSKKVVKASFSKKVKEFISGNDEYPSFDF